MSAFGTQIVLALLLSLYVQPIHSKTEQVVCGFALFVSGSGCPPELPGDQATSALIALSGYQVDCREDTSNILASEAEAYRFVYISSSVEALVSDSLKNASVPIAIASGGLYDLFALAEPRSNSDFLNRRTIFVTNDRHPITNGFSGSTNVYITENTLGTALVTSLAPGVVPLASLPALPMEIALFAADQGAQLLNSTTAASCRVGLFLETSTSDLTASGNAIFLNMINFLSQCSVCSGSVSGDPHFVGFLGQKYDVHGVAGTVFNLVSMPWLQINALFVAANMRMEKKKTYIGRIGLSGHGLRIVYGCDDGKGNPEILVNDHPLNRGEKFELPHGQVKRSRAQNGRTVVITPHLKLSMRLSDSYHSSCHINFRAKLLRQVKTIHGILGQSAWPEKNNAVASDDQGQGLLEGHWRDYAVTSGDIFGIDFRYNLYNESDKFQDLADTQFLAALVS